MRYEKGYCVSEKPNPTPFKIKFVEALEAGMQPVQAAAHAGSKDPQQYVHKVMSSDVWIKEEWARICRENAERAKMTREKVQDIVLEAVDMAKMLSMPGDMIRGAAELNKMCGFYAPDKVDITIEATLKRVQTQYEALSDAELIALMGDRLDPIEAEFRRLENQDD